MLLAAGALACVRDAPAQIAADPAAAEKQYRLAQRLGADGSPSAAAALEKVVALAPRGPYADDALVDLARLHGVPDWPEDLGGLDAAHAALARLPLEKVVASYADGDRALEAKYRLALVRLAPLPGRDPVRAREDLIALAASPSRERWPVVGRYVLGVLDEQAGARDRAAGAFARILVERPESDVAARAGAGFGRTMLAAGRFSEAASWFQEAIEGGAPPAVRADAHRELALVEVLRARVPTRRWAAVAAALPVIATTKGASLLAYAADGRFIVFDRKNDALQTFDAKGVGAPPVPLPEVAALAADPYGRVFAATKEQLVRCDAAGITVVMSLGSFGAPSAIAVDASGSVWIADRKGDRIARWAMGMPSPVVVRESKGAAHRLDGEWIRGDLRHGDVPPTDLDVRRCRRAHRRPRRESGDGHASHAFGGRQRHAGTRRRRRVAPRGDRRHACRGCSHSRRRIGLGGGGPVMRPLLLGLLALVASGVAPAADAPTVAGDDTQAVRELDAIRDQVVALDIEGALAAVDAFLARPGLSDARRVEAYDVRAQAHAASDDLAAAEKDYRAILELDAGYAPNRSVTSKRAMDRFVKLKASMIGTVHLDLEPRDAAIAVDDRPVAASADGSFQAVAGERRVRFTRKGFDPLDTTVHAVASQDTLVKIRLVPNARAIVVRTDVDGVTVTLDGTAAGATARGSGSGADGEASLVIEDVAIGEHEIALAKACFATENLQEIVTVDLADRSPKLLRVVTMRPARTRVTATGAGYQGDLRVDGERAASLPLTSFTLCPGDRTIEVVASGRVVWSGRLTAEATDLTLDLAARPNAVLVGAAWPKSWAEAAAGWSLQGRLDAPAGVDLTRREGWTRIALPPGTDLAVAVIPSAGIAGDDRTILYSPALHEVEDREAPPNASRPSWREATLSAVFVDSEAKSVVVASVAPDGPAAKAGLLAGDRVVAISGRAVTSAASARDAVLRSGIDALLALDVAPPAGAARRVDCTTTASPRIGPRAGDRASRVVRAAWASVDSAAGGPDAALALANLAVLLDRAGRDAAALEVWRRVRALAGGALAARAAYAMGVGLQAMGKGAEAVEAFGQAQSEGLTHADSALAAAAADRLADLGVASR
jgi:tetratricopeptide (TPR) repeat protein